jgi:hypothetical protein
MAILAYKAKQGDVFNLFGEGELIISEGVYRPSENGKEVLYLSIPEGLIGKDSSQKDESGKAKTIELVYPIKCKLELDMTTSWGRALSMFFKKIKPELADGFAGEINYRGSRSADRISKDDLSNADYDLKGGLCNLSSVASTIDWGSVKASGGGFQKTYKSVSETANERAAVLVSILEGYDKPTGMAYLKAVQLYTDLKLVPPTPLEIARFLCGDR